MKVGTQTARDWHVVRKLIRPIIGERFFATEVGPCGIVPEPMRLMEIRIIKGWPLYVAEKY